MARYFPHIDKRLHVLSILYDLMHIPFTGGFASYLLYIDKLSRPLYTAYMIERGGLWDDVIRCAVMKKGCEGVEDLVEALGEIQVYGWRRIRGELARVSGIVEGLFNDTYGRLVETLRSIMGFSSFFSEIHVVYGFNPGHGLYGSLLYYDGDAAVASVFANSYIEARRILDLVYHEVMHGLFHLNNVELAPETEEQLIDMLMPEGYLSRLLGLSDEIRIDVESVDEWLHAIVKDYFENKLYMAGENLLEKILRKDREHHIIYS